METSFFRFRWPSRVIPRSSQTSCSFSSIQSWGGQDPLCEAFRSSGFQNLSWPKIKHRLCCVQRIRTGMVAVTENVPLESNSFNCFYSFACMNVLLACKSVYHMHIVSMEELQLQRRYWESNLGPLKEQLVLLTTKPSLYPPNTYCMRQL